MTLTPVINSQSTNDKIGGQEKKQTSKAWYIVAIVVGTLVVVGIGGLGATGLLQSHGLISLPKELASAIGTIGHTPHFWSLWALAVGGGVSGISIAAFGIYKLHQQRKAVRGKSPNPEDIPPAPKVNQESLIEETKKVEETKVEETKASAKQVESQPTPVLPFKLENFGDHFEKIKIDKNDKDFTSLPDQHFNFWPIEGTNRKSWFFVLNDKGTLKCSKILTKQEKRLYRKELKGLKFKEVKS